MSLWKPVYSVLLCLSVRKRTHPRYEIRPMSLVGDFFLSRRIFLSLTELTDLTEPICALFRTHRTPPAYRYHRGLTPNPSPNGEGSSMRGYPFWPADDRRWAAEHLEYTQGYLGDHAPLHSERDGERLYRVCYRLLRGYVQAVLKYPYKLYVTIVRKSAHYH